MQRFYGGYITSAFLTKRKGIYVPPEKLLSLEYQPEPHEDCLSIYVSSYTAADAQYSMLQYKNGTEWTNVSFFPLLMQTADRENRVIWNFKFTEHRRAFISAAKKCRCSGWGCRNARNSLASQSFSINYHQHVQQCHMAKRCFLHVACFT